MRKKDEKEYVRILMCVEEIESKSYGGNKNERKREKRRERG